MINLKLKLTSFCKSLVRKRRTTRSLLPKENKRNGEIRLTKLPRLKRSLLRKSSRDFWKRLSNRDWQRSKRSRRRLNARLEKKEKQPGRERSSRDREKNRLNSWLPKNKPKGEDSKRRQDWLRRKLGGKEMRPEGRGKLEGRDKSHRLDVTESKINQQKSRNSLPWKRKESSLLPEMPSLKKPKVDHREPLDIKKTPKIKKIEESLNPSQ